jgi:glycosyltransferase involved in cell wall biosynthesis
MLVSIIIPVYNVEKYLRRCLDSVLAQTFQDYECILVDDGSPDNSPAICNKYAARDKRFKVIHKPRNEGLPRARQTGLDAAAAEWVIHLDSDDWIDPQALELLIKKQNETNADIVMGGYREICPWGIISTLYSEIEQDVSPLVWFFLSRYKNLWAKLYRKVLFIDYVIPTYAVGEDAVVNAQIFSSINIEKLQVVDRILYNYDHTIDGITIQMMRQFSYNFFTEAPAISFRLWIEKYLEESNQNDNVMAAFNLYMIEGLILYLRYNKKITKAEAVLFYTSYYKNCHYKRNISIHNRIVIPLFYRSIFLGKIYRLCINRLFDICKYILSLTMLRNIKKRF